MARVIAELEACVMPVLPDGSVGVVLRGAARGAGEFPLGGKTKLNEFPAILTLAST
jgi:hypothetical protein